MAKKATDIERKIKAHQRMHRNEMFGSYSPGNFEEKMWREAYKDMNELSAQD